MKEKDSFVFHKEWKEAVSGLPDEIRLETYEAIIDYGLNGKIRKTKSLSTLAFNFAKPTIDRDNEKSENTRRKRSEAGKKGGAPKGNKNASKRETDNHAKESDSRSVSVKQDTQVVIKKSHSFTQFEIWLTENCPYIAKNIKMMSDSEFQKLKDKFGSKTIANACLNMENRKDLRKRYANLYRTLLNWCKNENINKNGNNRQNYKTADERADDAMSIIERLAAEDDARRLQNQIS